MTQQIKRIAQFISYREGKILMVNKDGVWSIPGLKNENDLNPRDLLKNQFGKEHKFVLGNSIGVFQDDTTVSQIFNIKNYVDPSHLKSLYHNVVFEYVSTKRISTLNIKPISKDAINKFLEGN